MARLIPCVSQCMVCASHAFKEQRTPPHPVPHAGCSPWHQLSGHGPQMAALLWQAVVVTPGQLTGYCLSCLSPKAAVTR